MHQAPAGEIKIKSAVKGKIKRGGGGY